MPNKREKPQRGELERLPGGAVKRRTQRIMGLFIDGTGLDRATRRIEKRVDYANLVRGLTSGLVPEVSRYYCIIPSEDDSRQVAYLEAVANAGLEVITKRMPPKGSKRQVAVDVPIASDLLGFATGQFTKEQFADKYKKNDEKDNDKTIKRIATVVCPSQEVIYAFERCKMLGVEISLADFGNYTGPDSWKGVENWIDLSTSKTIWR